MERDEGFYWERQAAAEKACLDLLDECRRKNTALARFEDRLVRGASSLLFNWVDHFHAKDAARMRDLLARVGYVRRTDSAQEAFHHPGALLPPIVLFGSGTAPEVGVALRAEAVADFLQANGFRAEIEGAPFAPFRRAVVNTEGGARFSVVERRGTQAFDPGAAGGASLQAYWEGVEAWQNRPRQGDDEGAVLDEVFRIAERLVAALGPGLASHVACRCERSYWQSRNFAARMQHSRQEALGLGWGNHDHHTFRSSRGNFPRLLSLFTLLGFRMRERFYAGADAGWGAQVMEHPASGLTLFLDVDLAPDEFAADFSGGGLRDRDELGTVGLWCALHGDSILGAGLHHLAGQYDFEPLIRDLARLGVQYMAPFSNFPYLRQAFSVAEQWTVEPGRVRGLVDAKIVTAEQADRFLAHGAVGSHLENIDRREGYKGFNRKNVSAIIRDTDPRKHAA